MKTRFLTHKFYKTKYLLIPFFAVFTQLNAQEVSSYVDTTSIRIGEQITYKINVKTDSLEEIDFPKAKDFAPFELINEFKVDTNYLNKKFIISKKFALTYFDSGAYYIPSQKLTLLNKEVKLDSFKITINPVKIDTTKQGLYGIKPIMKSNTQIDFIFFGYILIFIAVICAVLLHDIGHGPFSHALEYTIVNGVHHEELSILFMKALNKHFKGELDLTIEIFTNKYHKKFLHQIISSQLDVDRLDYLTRDSFYTGVSEGVIGFDRILKMLHVVNDELVVEEKADFGIVVDPDVDRLAFVCEDGSMFGEEYTLVSVADFVLSKKSGNTVSNLSSTRALRDVTEKAGQVYHASAVGEG